MAAPMSLSQMSNFGRFSLICGKNKYLSKAKLSWFQTRRFASTIETKILARGNGKSIAYRYLDGQEPGLIFFPGFQSHMQGTKAMALEGYCKEKKIAFLRFDYQGCGESKGDLQEVSFSDWKGDALSALDQLTAGPQILVGSSMGAWMMLLAAIERPHRVHSMMGVASSVDFSDWGLERYPENVLQTMNEEGVAIYEKDPYTYVLSKKFFEDAQKHCLLQRDSLPVTCPVRLLHGMMDESVPFEISLKIAEKLWTRDVEVLLRKSADHRFSQPEEIQLMFEILDYLVYGAEEARKLAITSWQAFSIYAKPRQALSMIAKKS